jgi:hypothetical protein
MQYVISLESGERGAKSAFLGFALSCRFFMRGEPPHKNAASEAPFQDSEKCVLGALPCLVVFLDLLSERLRQRGEP